MAADTLDLEIVDTEKVARQKFKWSAHSPRGAKTIKVAEKYLLPVAKSPYVKALIYVGGGSSGKPLTLKISQKVDIWNHLNVSVKFHKYTINFIVVLNDKITSSQVAELISYFKTIFQKIKT